MNIKYVMLLVAGMVLTFSSCEQKKKNANIVVTELSKADSVQDANAPKLKGNKELNETARFVAGMPIEDKKSKLYTLTLRHPSGRNTAKTWIRFGALSCNRPLKLWLTHKMNWVR